MQIHTALPLATMAFKHWHHDDSEIGIVIAKACFRRHRNGRFYPATPAPQLVLTDIFAGDPAQTELVDEQDIAPGKEATDLLIRAIARSPGGAALPDWSVSVNIADRLSYGFQVRGPSMWRKALLGWKLEQPQPISELPLSYALAYGGAAPGANADEPPVFHQENPAGIGFATKELLAQGQPFAAAQIADLAEMMAPNPEANMMVHGLGPVAKTWLPRRSFAGTFDDQWKQRRHPRMPEDYSLRFWNCAPRATQITPFLKGNETIRISGISHAPAPVEVTLPGAGLMLYAKGDNPHDAPFTLDTVDLDLRATDPGEHRITMIWRCHVPSPDDFANAWIEPLLTEAG